jgi:hypothetical protein
MSLSETGHEQVCRLEKLQNFKYTVARFEDTQWICLISTGWLVYDSEDDEWFCWCPQEPNPSKYVDKYPKPVFNNPAITFKKELLLREPRIVDSGNGKSPSFL